MTTAKSKNDPQDQVDVNQDNLPAPNHYANCARKYIPIEAVIDLHRRGLSNVQAAKVLGCSTANVQKRLAKIGEIVANTETYKKNRSNVLAVGQQMIMSEVAAGEFKIQSARDLKDAATAFGILYDKERLEEGKSTQNIAVSSISADLERIDREIAELQARLEGQIGGSTPPGVGIDAVYDLDNGGVGEAK